MFKAIPWLWLIVAAILVFSERIPWWLGLGWVVFCFGVKYYCRDEPIKVGQLNWKKHGRSRGQTDKH